MDQRSTRRVDEFLATDSDGREYTIQVDQDFVLARDVWLPRLRTFRTSDGCPVNPLHDGIFEIITSNRAIRARKARKA